jgi:hypothetical protein
MSGLELRPGSWVIMTPMATQIKRKALEAARRPLYETNRFLDAS